MKPERRGRPARRGRRVASVAAVSGLGLLLVAGCGGGGSMTASTASAGTLGPVQSGEVTVQALDNNFRPDAITVKAGSTVVWTNSGRNDHNIIPVGDTPFKVDIAQFKPGETYRYQTSQTGTFAYYCSLHGTADGKGMAGKVQVVA